jgi:hypothetical protein
MLSFSSYIYPETDNIPSKSQLGYGTNPQYPSFPPMMQDGRSVISSWQPESVANNKIIKENSINSNWVYRNFLTKNAKKIIDVNRIETMNDTGYEVPSFRHTVNDKNVPYLYNDFKNINEMTNIEEPGKRSPSDLKTLYMSREELNSRKVVPSFMTIPNSVQASNS